MARRCGSMRLALAGLALAMMTGAAGAQGDASERRGDIRDLKVGVAITDLPHTGYVDFRCLDAQGAPGDPIAGWADFASCKAGPDGLHGLTFSYDDAVQPWAAVNDSFEGTKVAGHPVLLTVHADADGMIERIVARTDPDARFYMKKKAYLLSHKVMSRFGPEGWTCTDEEPADGRTAIGGMFIDRHCEKALEDRAVRLDVQLFRDRGQSEREFTNSTRFEITRRQQG